MSNKQIHLCAPKNILLFLRIRVIQSKHPSREYNRLYFVKYKPRHDKRYIMYISPILYGINIKNHTENKHNIKHPTCLQNC